MLLAAGILDIVAGVLYVGISVLYLILVSGLSLLLSGAGAPRGLAVWLALGTTVGVIFLLGLVALAGGILLLLKKNWEMAFAGSICALFIPFLGLSAAILLVVSRPNWSRLKKGGVLGILSFVALVISAILVLSMFV